MSNEPNEIGQFMIHSAAEQVAMECLLQAIIETHPDKSALQRVFEAFRASNLLRQLHGDEPSILKAVQSHYDKWSESLRIAAQTAPEKVSH
jgi:hypothetical protein